MKTTYDKIMPIFTRKLIAVTKALDTCALKLHKITVDRDYVIILHCYYILSLFNRITNAKKIVEQRASSINN